MDDKNPHYEEFPWGRKVYWKGNFACGRDSDPDHCVVESRKGTSWPSINFELPRQRHEMAKVLSLMEHAYERGAIDRSRAIGKTLNELISL